jgi:hypothetical protein
MTKDRRHVVGSGKKFVRLQKACCKSLEAFCRNSQQALNVLALAELFPNDIEKPVSSKLGSVHESAVCG